MFGVKILFKILLVFVLQGFGFNVSASDLRVIASLYREALNNQAARARGSKPNPDLALCQTCDQGKSQEKQVLELVTFKPTMRGGR